MLSFEERSIIHKLHNNGLSVRKIARVIGRPRRTIQRVLKHPPNIKKKGPNPKLSRRTKRAIALIAAKETIINIPLIKSRLNLTCSRNTISSALKEYNFRYGTCKILPKLTKRHLLARVAFAKEKRNWTSDHWDSVFFSDEKRFTYAIPDGPISSWMKKGRRKRVKKSTCKKSLMVWAAFSRTKKTDIVFVTGNMDSEMYIDILEHNLLGVMDPDDIFQQDNATCHTSRRTMTWFAEQGIEVMPWPAISPDLNPIENLWSYMQYKVYEGGVSFDDE